MPEKENLSPYTQETYHVWVKTPKGGIYAVNAEERGYDEAWQRANGYNDGSRRHNEPKGSRFFVVIKTISFQEA